MAWTTSVSRYFGIGAEGIRIQWNEEAGAGIMRKRASFNPKRRIRVNCDPDMLANLARRVTYGGNPEHKRSPGDFGLTPPSQPRADKTLCDGVSIHTRSDAGDLLRKGVRRGLISEQVRGEYPQNIWSVSDDDQPLEAQLENADQGVYHGYPMPTTDPMRDEVLARWNES